jgi:hypothetical protein
MKHKMNNNQRYREQVDDFSPKRSRVPETSRSNEREQSPGRIADLKFQNRKFSPTKKETKKTIDIEASVKNV